MNVDLRQGKSNSLMIDMLKEKLDAIIEDREAETAKQEKQILQLQDYNIWNVWEEKNIERQMTVEFEKYLIRASEILGGVDVGNYTAYQFLCMNEMLQEKARENGK